jgi:hypothetical protein
MQRTSKLPQKTLRYLLPTVAGVSFVGLALAQQKQANKPKEDATKSVVLEAKTDATKATPDEKPQANGRRSLEFYTKGANAILFNEPLPPEPKPVVIKIAPPPPPPPVKLPVQPVEIDPFVDWAYTGTVTLNGQKMVLLENTKTKEGQYLRVGESFLGGQVMEITEANVVMMMGRKPRQLFKSQTFNLVPLNASAAGAGGAPGQPPPGMPPPPGGMPPPPPPNGAPMMGGQFSNGVMMLNSPVMMEGGGRVLRLKR